MEPDTIKRLESLEAAVKRIEETELVSNVELRRLGIENGSKGVKAALALIGFIFIVNTVYAYVTSGSQVFESLHLIYLGVVVSLALVAYFGFIFKFTVSAKFSKKGGEFGTHTSSGDN